MIKKYNLNSDLPLFSISDLNERWHYTRAGIHKLVRREDFPKPMARINKGKIKVFSKEDIVAYEKDKPWLFNESLKFSKQHGYFSLQQAKDFMVS